MNIFEICDVLIKKHSCYLLSGTPNPAPGDVDIYVPPKEFDAVTVFVLQDGFVLTEYDTGQKIFRRYENSGELYILDLMSSFEVFARRAGKIYLSESGNRKLGESPELSKCFKYVCLQNWGKIDYVEYHKDALVHFLCEPENFVAHGVKPSLLTNISTTKLMKLMKGGFYRRSKQRLVSLMLSFNRGYSVALIGPDGAGKSFFINKLAPIGDTRKVYLGDWFFVMQSFYNFLLKIPSPWNRLVYPLYLIENHIRILRVFAWRLRGKIVLIDRFPGTNRNVTKQGILKWMNDLTFKLVPKPDLLVLLTAPPSVVRSRKQELTEDQIDHNQRELMILIKNQPHLVLSTTDIDAALNQLLAVIAR